MGEPGKVATFIPWINETITEKVQPITGFSGVLNFTSPSDNAGRGDFWVRADCDQVLLYPLNDIANENFIQIFDPINMTGIVWAYESIVITGKYKN